MSKEHGIGVNALKLAAVTDIHHGRNDETKYGTRALELLEHALGEIEALAPDLLIDLGDRITDENVDEDRRLSAEVIERFRATAVPRAHLLGNHDIEFLDAGEQEREFGCSLQSHSRHLNGWQLIFWKADPTYRRGNLRIPDADMRWLERELSAASYPAVVFTHVPMDGGSMHGNYYFDRDPDGRAHHYNVEEARRIITAGSNVVLAVAGHTHWNRLNTIDGVHFVTIQSLTERFTTYPDAAASWAEIELGETIHVDVHGRDPIRLALPIRERGRHWKVRPPAGTSGASVHANSETEHPSSGEGGAPGNANSGAEEAPATSVSSRSWRARGVILDLDGVVYSGTRLLPGATEFLSELRARQIRLVALTNHTGHRAGEVSKKLAAMGFDLPTECVLTAGWATANYLANASPGATVYVLGDQALASELTDAGLAAVGTGSPVDACDYVVAGYCTEFSRREMEAATARLLAGAQLIGTNPDRLLPTPNGFIPEAGPLISFLEEASGRRATIIGKPSRHIVELALSRLEVPASQAVIVGDNPETDIVAARNAGIASVLIAGGRNDRTKPHDRRPCHASRWTGAEPTLRVRDLAELAELVRDRDAGAHATKRSG